jgi:hypothetical protein
VRVEAVDEESHDRAHQLCPRHPVLGDVMTGAVADSWFVYFVVEA